jgi:hypothetical protein
VAQTEGSSDQVTMKLLRPCVPSLLLQSRRDEIFIDNVMPNEFSQPIYGRHKGDVAPKGALEFEPTHPAINISSLRDFKTVFSERRHLFRVSFSL